MYPTNQQYSNYGGIALISHDSKLMRKILQASLQQCVNQEIPNVQAGFRKSRGTRDQIIKIHCIIYKAREFQNKQTNKQTKKKKQGNSRTTSTSASLTTLKPLTTWITTVGNS